MIKIYACEYCKYRTKRIADLQRHKNKKTSCINRMKVNVDKKKVAENVKDDAENVKDVLDETVNVMASPVNVMASPVNVMADSVSTTDSESNTNNKIECSKCFRPFARKYNMKVHEKKCDGTHILQCKICLKLFSTRQSKWEHKLNVKCSPPAITNAITTTNNMNNNNITIDKSTNNNNITNNNFNLIKADFGKENLDKMYRDPNYFKNIADNIEMGRYAIPKTIEFIYFNDDYPENQTLKKDRRNDKLVSIHQKGKWQTRMFEDVQNDILRQSEEYHKSYLQNLEETVDTTVKDKKFKERMLPVACFLRIMKENGWSCADVKNIGVNLDYEMDDEDYKRMLSCKKEMELLMLDKIHEETTVMYHNISVAQNALE